jgi:hypothetical protein
MKVRSGSGIPGKKNSTIWPGARGAGNAEGKEFPAFTQVAVTASAYHAKWASSTTADISGTVINTADKEEP